MTCMYQGCGHFRTAGTFRVTQELFFMAVCSMTKVSFLLSEKIAAPSLLSDT